jgi:hypothetical protein
MGNIGLSMLLGVTNAQPVGLKQHVLRPIDEVVLNWYSLIQHALQVNRAVRANCIYKKPLHFNRQEATP